MSELTKIITKLIISEGDINFYNNHISLVVKHAIALARIENEDEEAIELAALLHDIGRIRHGGEKHNLKGEKIAREILKQHNYDPMKTEQICNAIISHDGTKEFPVKDVFGKIIRSADGLSHLDIVPLLLTLEIQKKNGDVGKSVKRLIEKLNFEWDNKITLKSARRIGKAKYESAILVLKSKLDVLNQVGQNVK